MASRYAINPRYYCEICRTWLANDKLSIRTHEQGNRHKSNLKDHLSRIRQDQYKEQQQKDFLQSTLAAIEVSAKQALLQQDGTIGVPSTSDSSITSSGNVSQSLSLPVTTSTAATLPSSSASSSSSSSSSLASSSSTTVTISSSHATSTTIDTSESDEYPGLKKISDTLYGLEGNYTPSTFYTVKDTVTNITESTNSTSSSSSLSLQQTIYTIEPKECEFLYDPHTMVWKKGTIHSLTDSIDSLTYQYLSRSVQIQIEGSNVNTLSSTVSMPLSRIRFLLTANEADKVRKQVIQDAIQQQHQPTTAITEITVPDTVTEGKSKEPVDDTVVPVAPVEIEETTGLGVWQSSVIVNEDEEGNTDDNDEANDGTGPRSKRSRTENSYHSNPSKALDMYVAEQDKRNSLTATDTGHNTKSFGYADEDTYGATDILALNAPFGTQTYKGIKLDDDSHATNHPSSQTVPTPTNSTTVSTTDTVTTTNINANPTFKKRNINTNIRIRKRDDE